MNFKKTIAALLMLSMVLADVGGMVGMHAFATDRTGNSVEYTYLAPEVAILNAYTGNDSAFLNSVLYDTNFNFAEQVPGLGYKTMISKDTTVVYPNFKNTVLSRLGTCLKNPMEASYSATFYNKHGHTHNIFLPPIDIPTPYISAVMYINGSTISTPAGWRGINSRVTRQGNGEYSEYSGYGGQSQLEIRYTNSIRYYSGWGAERTCTCGGDVNNHTIVFRDKTAPIILYAKILDETGVEKKEFKIGDKVVIKLVSNEPLRFAANRVPEKAVCVGLKLDGGDKNSQLIANLTGLTKTEYPIYSGGVTRLVEASEMTFEYIVSAEDIAGGIQSVIGIDFAPQRLSSNQVALYDATGTAVQIPSR